VKRAPEASGFLQLLAFANIDEQHARVAHKLRCFLSREGLDGLARVPHQMLHAFHHHADLISFFKRALFLGAVLLGVWSIRLMTSESSLPPKGQLLPGPGRRNGSTSAFAVQALDAFEADCVLDLGSLEVGASRIGAGQICPGKVRTDEIGLMQVGAGQVRAGQVGEAQQRVAEFRAGEVGAGQVRA